VGNCTQSTWTFPNSTVVPSISESSKPTTAFKEAIGVDDLHDRVATDTAKTPSTSTNSSSTNAITGNPVTSTTNAVPRKPSLPINHHYFTHANSFVGIHNDRVPADTWAKPQGHLKSPTNIVQASVAEDGRAKQNYVQHGEHFPAHVYSRTTATRICAYNKNVQQPSTKMS